jgi:hypothetical protein
MAFEAAELVREHGVGGLGVFVGPGIGFHGPLVSLALSDFEPEVQPDVAGPSDRS